MTDNTRESKLERLMTIMHELSNRMESDASSEWPEHELTMTQFKAMTYLQAGPRRMSDISRFLNVGLSSVTNLVGRLESKGLVQRSHDTEDRRVVTCDLTDEGRETIASLWRVGREQLIRVAGRLEDGELDRVLAAFEILLDAAARTQNSIDSN